MEEGDFKIRYMEVVEEYDKKSGMLVYKPDFLTYTKKNSGLMTRGNDFYAAWIPTLGRWTTEESELLEYLDGVLKEEAERRAAGRPYKVLYFKYSSTRTIDRWHTYVKNDVRTKFVPLDDNLTFQNTPVNIENYASKCLPYAIEPGSFPCYEKLISTLYDPVQRHKIEWAIGAVLTGDAKTIQKFLVFYGSAGTGKSTILNIINKLFKGYTAIITIEDVASKSNSFGLEQFANHPLVAIQHDCDLSRIETNAKINSIVSHENMLVNPKYKSPFIDSFKCMMFLGTNKTVQITDAKSGLLRRLIDVVPTGEKIKPVKEYDRLMTGIEFELGAIAYHCRQVYEEDPNCYDDYVPMSMMGATNDMYNFVQENYFEFKRSDTVTLKYAYGEYKKYCENANVRHVYTMTQFKEEFKNYFSDFQERGTGANRGVWNVYSGFMESKFDVLAQMEEEKSEDKPLLDFGAYPSNLDIFLAECKAQYATETDKPSSTWDSVTTTLSDLDTKKTHYVKVPENLIIVDFDIPNPETGKKDFQLNLEAASKWPATYAELSKSGGGIHLHYIYNGDVTKLSRIFADHIEIKVYRGNSSLRRKLTKCTNLPIASISSGLPLKEQKVVKKSDIKDAAHLANKIKYVLKNKQSPFGDHTAECMGYINKLVEEAYASGMPYDISSLYTPIVVFASRSTNQQPQCLSIAKNLYSKLTSETEFNNDIPNESPLTIYDVEVAPNHFLICFQIYGTNTVVAMLDPSPDEVRDFIDKHGLVGFNNKAYDNHMCCAREDGYNFNELFKFSGDIVNKKRTSPYPHAKHISTTDIFDFAAKKQSLKKWEIELEKEGLLPKGSHKEWPLHWDEPIPDDMLEEWTDYCKHDVKATAVLFDYLKGDWTARKILAELAGMTPNDSTNALTTRIIFGTNKHPELVYTDLSIDFPGYSYEDGKNMYRGVDMGFGGYVYAEPGMYENVALLDVASLHPHSIKAMNCFGEYTKNFVDLMDARIFIKHKDFDSAKKIFDGKLAKYLDDPAQAKQLSQALKIAINSVYGLTSAKFDNPFRDPRNVNNIVALRGALFMKTLQDEVVARGFKVAHIKTDSIKIPNATPEIIQFCMEFANKYGYDFEHEATYDRMCLVNDAVYIARYSKDEVNGDHCGQWTATGTQFQVPYVFKTLFSKEPIGFYDVCESKSAKDPIYLRHPNGYLQFVGKTGMFMPTKSSLGCELLVKRTKGDTEKYDAVAGSKGYLWLEADDAMFEDADRSYYAKLCDDAVNDISKYGDFEWFTSTDE